jgi:LacI family transcriptional regulator
MPTMADVAARAGVSVATVSRVLSGKTAVVSGPVRQRVLDAAEELQYHPNNLARNMRWGTSRIFGLVISDVANPFFTAVARGVEDVAHRNGYYLVLANTDEDADREAATLAVMTAERAAGLIIATTNQNGDLIRRTIANGSAVVAVDRRVRGLSTDTVAVDNDGAAHEAVSHLIHLGHRRIAIIGGPRDADSASERLRGYERAHRDARLPIDPDLVIEGNFRERGGLDATRRLMTLPQPPTGIFAVNNLTTIGVLRALGERGSRIPADVSVVGFDDMPTAELLSPPLTTVRQPTYRIGVEAARLLVRRIEDPQAPIQELQLTADLIVRGSTGPPA